MMFSRMSVPELFMVAVMSLFAGQWDVWNFWAYAGIARTNPGCSRSDRSA